MTEIQGKSILVRVSEGSSNRESTVLNICIPWIVPYLEDRSIHLLNNLGGGGGMFDSQFFVMSAINPKRSVGN